MAYLNGRSVLSMPDFSQVVPSDERCPSAKIHSPMFSFDYSISSVLFVKSKVKNINSKSKYPIFYISNLFEKDYSVWKCIKKAKMAYYT